MCMCRQFLVQRSLNVKDTVITNQRFKYHKNFCNSITATFYSIAISLDVFVSFFFFFIIIFIVLVTRLCVHSGCFLTGSLCERVFFVSFLQFMATSWQTKMIENDLAYFMHAHTEWKCKYFSTGFRVSVVFSVIQVKPSVLWQHNLSIG